LEIKNTKIESFIIGCILGAVPVMFCFVTAWFVSAVLLDEKVVPTVALSGLGVGMVIDIAFLKRWIKKAYQLSNKVLIAIYIFYSIGVLGFCMGVPILNFGLRILAGIYPNYQGSKKIIGKIIPLIDLGRGLNERLTMTENIFLLGSFFGLSQKEIKKKINSIIKLTDLQKFVNTKLYQFSNGMKTRLAFSIAMHCGPDILLLDEVFAVGDENFRLTSAEKIKRIVKKGGSVIFVSHELQMIEKYCDRVIIMDKGRIIALGKPREMIEKLKNKAIPSSS